MAKSKSTRQPAVSSLPDRKSLEKRVANTSHRLFEIKAIAGGPRAAVADMTDGDGSDADYALGAVCRMLNDLASELDVTLLAPEQAQEVANGQA